MAQRFKSLSISVFVLLLGVALQMMARASAFRFPKAEAAGYLFLLVGVIATVVTGYGALRYVAPRPGSRVHFWGPDGRSKLVGRIARMEGGSFTVETEAGNFTLKESQFLRVEKAPE